MQTSKNAETWRKAEQLGTTLGHVDAICTLLYDPTGIPDDLEVALYAYADRLVKDYGPELAAIYDASIGSRARIQNIIMDIIKQRADMGG